MAFKVLFKTKSGIKEGIGDVTSSLALAKEFVSSAGDNITFITNNDRSGIRLIKRSGYRCEILDDLELLEKYLSAYHNDIAILNQLDTPYDEALIFKRNSRMLVTIEDTAVAVKLADLRFNILYPIKGTITDFCFIPLFRSFQKKHSISRVIKKEVRNILVMQGGSDTYGFTLKIIKSLFNISSNIDINVVIGPNFLFSEELSKLLNNAPRDFNIIRGENDLSNLISNSDMAVTAAGNTLFELACLGVPSVVVCGEPFEMQTAQRLENEGFGINLGFGKNVTEKNILKAVNKLINDFNLRSVMSKVGRKLIDGRGASRMFEKITSFYSFLLRELH